MEKIVNISLPREESLASKMLVFSTETKTIFLFDEEVNRSAKMPLSQIIRMLIDAKKTVLLLKLIMSLSGEVKLVAAKGSEYNVVDDNGVIVTKQREQDKFALSTIKVEQSIIEDILNNL